ncbi:head completion/stabilization protein [Histophilus somni]|uniref:Head completion/stabilization protein n=1 Tax=Histophilus somni TaxID=731 RepID=A0AAX2RX32_HISSO|nr:head completion/stabilization protein [Histophilus somni]TDF37027.1 head completion/stabilization protein [Histophilus somni]TEW26970.1 head completion/stabilization protein [Histophilus somni]TFF00714.1 head completion/stabilization protein [Histophilus somni]THA88737.1 head completion/stabilization protein [Histophilus somni]TJY47550.1 head completion/stabilization protein [Histophilus somni]
MHNSIAIKKVKNYAMDDLKRQAEEQATDNETIQNNGFFPDIHLLDVRNAMRIDGTVTNERLKMEVIEAMATANNALKHYQKTLKEKHIYRLEDMNDEKINGENIVIQRYKRAVYCFALANLNERYRSYDTTKQGAEKAQDFEQSVDDLRRDGRFAIRDIVGQHRMIVELI